MCIYIYIYTQQKAPSASAASRSGSARRSTPAARSGCASAKRKQVSEFKLDKLVK